MIQKFLNLIKRQPHQIKPMDNFSQEHLDQLINRQKYLRAVVNGANKKFAHPNWTMLHDFGAPATVAARSKIAEELVTVSMEIDFLAGFLKE